MRTRLSLLSGSGLTRRTRVLVILVAALLPFTVIAQQSSAPASQAGARSLLSPATATPIPFTGPGWQDKVLLHEGYVMPPPELAAAVLAPREMNIALQNPSPDRKWFLDEIGDGPVPMSIFGRPFDELGGVFIDWKANRERAMTRRNTIGVQIISAADGSRRAVATPAGLRVTSAQWTEDSTAIIYLTLADDGTYLWMTDLATNKPRQISKASLLTTFVTTYGVINTGRSIVAVFPPDGRTPRPSPPAIPPGPEVIVSMDADRNRLRTFPSLMRTPYEFQLLEWHATGQIGIVDLATGTITKFGTPAMITGVDMNPTGKYARVTRMTKPFSFIVPTSSFGSTEEIWESTGKVLAKLSEQPLNLGLRATVADPVDPTNPDPQANPGQQGGRGRGGDPAGGNGRRNLMWRADGDGFNYLQQEPAAAAPAAQGQGAGGRQSASAPAAQPPRRDRMMQWLPPFSETSTRLIYEHPTRMTGLRFSVDDQVAFFQADGQMNAMYLSDTTSKYAIYRTGGGGGVAGRGADAARAGGTGGGGQGRGGGGANPSGRLMAVPTRVPPDEDTEPFLPVRISPDGSSVYLESTNSGGRGGATPTSSRPFIDRVVIKTGERTRLFEGQPGALRETIETVIDPETKKVVLTRQSATTPPQQFLYDNGAVKQLTNNEDLFPDLTRMIVQRLEITRGDGFKFRTIVYLPSDYKEGTRLPGFFWFYPYEFTSQEEFNTSRNGGASAAFSLTPRSTFRTFTSLSKQFLTRLGYAVIENQSPIVGDAGAMNNNYVNDLRNNLAATIDELDRRMLIDRTRLAIGGHSYGAFSTVNAMVHTPFFRAGIAGDGAYNRTLTPLGFQSERRDLWQAPNVYLDMSPFLRANNLSGALLMYHGQHDQNVGTDPINSIRMFHALNGLGKTVALYNYPYEGHTPTSRETLLDLWSRWAAWLDKYVKNPAPPNKPAPAPQPNAGRGGGGQR